MVIDEENNIISKALMNRFVAIYLDEYLELNDNNLKEIINKTENRLNMQLLKSKKEPFIESEEESGEENGEKSEEEIEEDNENNEGNDNNYEKNEEEEEDDDKDEDDNYNVNDEENKNIPEWYNIKPISKKTIDEIIKFFKVNKHNLNIMKYLIKKIIKLSLIYERISRFGFSVNDCNDILNFNFNKHYEFVQIYKTLEENILLKDEKSKKNEGMKKINFFMIFRMIHGK